MLDPRLLAHQLLTRYPELRQKIEKAASPPLEDAAKGLEETIKFLVLASEVRAPACTPSTRVDLVWHEFILFTRLYADFCQQHFGKFIHHEPSKIGVSCSLQYERTLVLYLQRYGPPDAFWWESPRKANAQCGMCDAIDTI